MDARTTSFESSDALTWTSCPTPPPFWRVLCLSVDQFIAKKNLSSKGELKTRIKRTLHAVDPTDKDSTYQGIRQGLSDGTSFYSVSTLHGYVHNRHFHPDGSSIRSIAANLSPFLQALNDNA